MGGPIRKDRLFFFFDTEGLRLVIPQLLFTVIPTLEFEAATIANIDSKFGANSASDAFYKQIFKLYDGTPRASMARVEASILTTLWLHRISIAKWARHDGPLRP